MGLILRLFSPHHRGKQGDRRGGRDTQTEVSKSREGMTWDGEASRRAKARAKSQLLDISDYYVCGTGTSDFGAVRDGPHGKLKGGPSYATLTCVSSNGPW